MPVLAANGVFVVVTFAVAVAEGSSAGRCTARTAAMKRSSIQILDSDFFRGSVQWFKPPDPMLDIKYRKI
jgi:hypothetical protein